MFKMDIETVENKEKIERFKREILKGLSLEKFTDSEDMFFNDTIEACINSAISSAESYHYDFKALKSVENDGD